MAAAARLRAALLAALACLPAVAGATTVGPLDAAENAWLAAHGPVRVVYTPGFMPFTDDADGRPVGINRDFLALASVRTGVEFAFIPATNLTAALEMMRDGRGDLTGNVGLTPERDAFLEFTEPYAAARTTLWRRAGDGPREEDRLAGATVSVVRGTQNVRILATDFPLARAVEVASVEEGVRALADGRVDAFIGPVPSTAHFVVSLGLDGIEPFGGTVSESVFRWAVPEGETTLHAIVEKALGTVTADERRMIFEKWSGQDLRPATDARVHAPTWLLPALVLAVGAALALAALVLVLRAAVRARTREAREGRDRLAAVLDSTSEAVFTRDPTGRFLTLNPAGGRVLGVDPREALGRPAAAVLDASVAEAVSAGDEAVLREGRPSSVERAVATPDGERVLSTANAPLRDERGRVIGIVSVTRDLTAVRRAQADRNRADTAAAEVARLREAESVRTQILNSISHELRTPLTPMRVHLHLLRSRLTGEGERETVAIIDRNLARLNALVDDILDVARAQSATLSLDLAHGNVADVARETVEAFAPEARQVGVRLDLDAPQEATAVMDRRRVGQILMNLVSNALKFTPRGGSVTVRVREDGRTVAVDVIDDGEGIAADDLPRLFRPFVQARGATERTRSGTGLGLSICRSIAEQHGGTVTAASEGLGRGSTFHLEIPVAGPGAGSADDA